MVIAIILNVSHLNNNRNTDSRAGRSLTNRWRGNTVCTKPTLPCIFECVPPQRNFLHRGHPIGDYGANLHSNSSPIVKLVAVLNNVCGSNSIFQQSELNLKEGVSVCKFRVEHEILDTSSCSFHCLMVDRNSIERHAEDEMRLRWTFHNKWCQLEDLKPAYV